MHRAPSRSSGRATAQAMHRGSRTRSRGRSRARAPWSSREARWGSTRLRTAGPSLREAARGPCAPPVAASASRRSTRRSSTRLPRPRRGALAVRRRHDGYAEQLHLAETAFWSRSPTPSSSSKPASLQVRSAPRHSPASWGAPYGRWQGRRGIPGSPAAGARSRTARGSSRRSTSLARALGLGRDRCRHRPQLNSPSHPCPATCCLPARPPPDARRASPDARALFEACATEARHIDEIAEVRGFA